MYDKTYFDMSNAQKIALLLISLGKKTAAEILSQLPEEDVKEVSYWIHHTPLVSAEMTKNAIEEFYARLHGSLKASYSGGKDYLYEILKSSVGDLKAKKILQNIEGHEKKDSPLKTILATADPKQLADFFNKESVQTAALMLYHIDPARFAAILSHMSNDKQEAILIALIQMEDLESGVIQAFSKQTAEVFEEQSLANHKYADGSKIAVKVLGHFSKERQLELLANINKHNPLLATKISNLLFVYKHLLSLDEDSIQILTKNCKPLDFALALYNFDDELKAKFFEHMTGPTLETIKKQLADAGPVTPYSIQSAQQNILNTLLQLQAVNK
jgi:flagellar motor switch protein FliG